MRSDRLRAARHYGSLHGDYGGVFDDENVLDRSVANARRWAAQYGSLVDFLQSDGNPEAFGLAGPAARARELRNLRARQRYWEHVLTEPESATVRPPQGR